MRVFALRFNRKRFAFLASGKFDLVSGKKTLFFEVLRRYDEKKGFYFEERIGCARYHSQAQAVFHIAKKRGITPAAVNVHELEENIG